MENLKSGTQLGPYEVLEPIGEGGMGQVYTARDSRLDRTVAIKVAREQFSERFDREARAVAALNHPNICTLHDVGPNYLVMELVEGPTLAERLKVGAIPVEEALRIARQIANALEAAHEKEIVHRDLKPANVKIKPDGTVKVLDFGLAKIGASSTGAGELPTIGGGATQAGTILGTAGYMSPEQARGQSTDRRADIWAFGVILYEMLTGERLFEGETLSDSLAQILTKEPDFDRVPAGARRLVRACLEKDVKKRLRDIADAWRLLDETPTVAAPATRSLLRSLWPVAAVALFLLGAATSFYYFRSSVEPAGTIRFQIAEPGATQPMISPDGRWIVFIGSDTALYLRSLESGILRKLEGTDGAAGPFWSPDNRSIAFISKSNLQRVDVEGGSPQVLCSNLPAFRGGTWNKNGVILVGGNQSGLYRVPDRGGEPMLVLTPDPSQKEASYSSPYFLPDQQHYLYSVAFLGAPSAVFLGSLDSKEHTQLLTPSSRVALASGYLFFTRDQTLFAQPFDTKNFKLGGDAIRVVDDVANSRGSNGEFSVSGDGKLVYRQGVGLGASQFVWLDRKGTPAGIVGMPTNYGNFDLSDDGKSLAVDVRDRAGAQNIWLMDLVTGVNEQITNNGRSNNNSPVLSPDGQVAFISGTGQGDADIYVQKIGGLKKEAVLISTPSLDIAQDWSPDGQYVAYIDGADTERRTLSAMPLFGERKALPIVKVPGIANFGQAHFSFDGKWVAYVSSESGTPQIYVVSFPGADKQRQVSANGGGQPRWRRDGKELYYLNMDGKMMAVDMNLGATIEFKAAHELFDARVTLTPFATEYQVMPNGQRFLVKQRANEALSPINVVLNWAPSSQK